MGQRFLWGGGSSSPVGDPGPSDSPGLLEGTSSTPLVAYSCVSGVTI